MGSPIYLSGAVPVLASVTINLNVGKGKQCGVFLGERFGLLAVKVALANIFGEFTVLPTDKTPEKIILDPRGATITPSEDLHLKYVKLEAPYRFQ